MYQIVIYIYVYVLCMLEFVFRARTNGTESRGEITRMLVDMEILPAIALGGWPVQRAGFS